MLIDRVIGSVWPVFGPDLIYQFVVQHIDELYVTVQTRLIGLPTTCTKGHSDGMTLVTQTV